MTATDQMRAMLDQLMGTSRNGKKNIIFFFNFINSKSDLVLIVAFMVVE